MSRDHYRGIPKTVNAVVDSKRNIKPLSPISLKNGYNLNVNTEGTYNFGEQRLSNRIELFVRNTGNDSNDGLTEGTAVLSLQRLRQLLPPDLGNNRYVINLTGYTGVIEPLNSTDSSGTLFWPALKSTSASSLEYYIHDNGQQLLREYSLNFVAAPTKILDITPISKSKVANPASVTTDIYEITVSETLTPGALVGKFLIGESTPGLYAVITSNTASTIRVANSTDYYNYLNATGVYEPSCNLTYGDATKNQYSSKWLVGCSMAMSGIKFKSAHATAPAMSVSVQDNSYFYALLCDIDGLLLTGATNPTPWLDACHITKTLVLETSSVTSYSSFFDGCTFFGHGDGGTGKQEFNTGTTFIGCGALGGGNSERSGGMELNNCHFINSTGVAVTVDGPNKVTLDSCYIEGAGSHAIYADSGGTPIRVRDVHGTGNGGYGLYLANGQQALLQSTGGSFPSVSGTAGQVRLGSKSVTWASGVPQTDWDNVNPDLIEGCRIF